MGNSTTEKGTPNLYLLPVPISESENPDWIGGSYHSILKSVNLIFVENIRTTRRFISALKLGINIDSIQFEELDKNTDISEIQRFIKLIIDKGNGIIMSESGCPGIADPGALLVNLAHKKAINIVPVVGPSSIILALMGAGLSGQCFAFHGYLPIEKKERELKIRELEVESLLKRQTQIFIETPYRNSNLWNSLLSVLKPETQLAFATDVLGKEQKIKKLNIQEWLKLPTLVWEKFPTVFLFQA